MLAQVISASVVSVFAWAMIELAGYQLAYGERIGAWVCRALALALGFASAWMWSVIL